MTTAITALRAWIPLINLNNGSTVPFSLIDKLANELAPIGIADCFSKFTILDPVFYTQTFTANHLIIVYQLDSNVVFVPERDQLRPATLDEKTPVYQITLEENA